MLCSSESNNYFGEVKGMVGASAFFRRLYQYIKGKIREAIFHYNMFIVYYIISQDIKNTLRNNITQERFTDLVIIYIEYEFYEKIDVTEIIDKFGSQTARKDNV